MLTSTTETVATHNVQKSTTSATQGGSLRVQLKGATFAQGAAMLAPRSQANEAVQKKPAGPEGVTYRVLLFVLDKEPTRAERDAWVADVGVMVNIDRGGGHIRALAGHFQTEAEAEVLRAKLAQKAGYEGCSVVRIETPDALPAVAPSVNDKILAAAQAFRGTSTADGPGGGNVSCAYAMNKVLKNAIGRTIGSNTNAVTSIAAALAGGEGTPVQRGQEQPGDLVIAPNGHHIGVYLGGGKVLSNSSSKAAYVWESGVDYDNFCGSGASTIYRVKPN